MMISATRSLMVLPALVAITFVSFTVTSAQTRLPNPVLTLISTEPSQSGGKSLIRYKYEVHNREAYPDSIFAAAPELPPCGQNTRASRTWVDLYDQRGKRLFGFCALGAQKDLTGIWFALDSDEIPPSYIYIEMTDRQTGTKYKSNLAETTL